MIPEDEFSPLLSPHINHSLVAKSAVDLITKIKLGEQNPIEANPVLRDELVSGLSGLFYEHEKNLYNEKDEFKSISNTEFDDAIKKLGSAKSLLTELPDKINTLLNGKYALSHNGIRLSDIEKNIEASIVFCSNQLERHITYNINQAKPKVGRKTMNIEKELVKSVKQLLQDVLYVKVPVGSDKAEDKCVVKGTTDNVFVNPYFEMTYVLSNSVDRNITRSNIQTFLRKDD